VVLRGFSALSYHRLEGLGFVTATFPRPAFFHLFTTLDFSHIWAKGIDKLLTPTAQEGVIEGPTAYQPLE
jgi:hypothetical protein